MEVARLYESPFTDHAPHGPDIIFTDDQVHGIVAILDEVRCLIGQGTETIGPSLTCDTARDAGMTPEDHSDEGPPVPGL